MTNRQLFGPENFIRRRWKNGLGFTTELLRQDLDNENFAWRLSIARVTEDGPFSNFEGYQRTLLLLKGRGITLDHGDGSRQVLKQTLDAAIFSGKGPTVASLHDGPIKDFNIMTRDGICSARTHAGAAASQLVQTTRDSLLLIYAAAEAISVNLDGETLPAIPVGHLLRAKSNQPLPLSLTGSGCIAIEIINAIASDSKTRADSSARPRYFDQPGLVEPPGVGNNSVRENPPISIMPQSRQAFGIPP